MKALDVILIAEEHAGANESARLCLEDAKKLLDKGNEKFARERAIKSIAYSCGVCSTVYAEVTE